MKRFHNRRDAGKQLAQQLTAYKNDPDILVLALPRGGVPVAYEIATALSVPLDIFVVKKLGLPGYEELAMGAIAMGDTLVFNEALLKNFQLEQRILDKVIAQKKQELEEAIQDYRGNQALPQLNQKTIILVDDGIATGSTIYAAIKAIKNQHPKNIIVATPVAPREVCQEIEKVVNDFICLLQPEEFIAVGNWYEDFSQVSTHEVKRLLTQFKKEPHENKHP